MANIEQQIEVLSRRCERILTVDDLKTRLTRSGETGRPLRIKLGLDPTAPDVTLGHAVPLKVIRQFQEWGHKAVLIIGDYTARVGDPSGRNTTRPVLTGEEIDRNAQTYVNQLAKILLTDPEHLELRYNGEWLGKMGLVDIIRLAGRMTVAQVLQREDFASRFNEAAEIRLHELMYPLLQGWDSVQIQADIEMGGSDQLFNNLVGREFQREEGQEPQVVMVTPLLVGTDGKVKMSKSKGNSIAVTDPPSGPEGMFGKIMSLPDHLMESYYTLLTDLPAEEFVPLIRSNPRNAKVRLAKIIIGWLHDAQAAESAEAEFDRIFKQKQVPQEMPEVVVGPGGHRLAPVMVKAGLVSSNSEGIRKIKEGAVMLDGQKVPADGFQKEYDFEKPTVLKLGRRFVRVVGEQ